MALRRWSFLFSMMLAACGGDGVKVADLRGETLTIAPTSLTPGGVAQVSFSLRNDGAAPAAAFQFETRLATPDGGAPVSLGRRPVELLAPGVPATQMYQVAIPTSTPAGTYQLQVVIDPDNTVAESDETNNVVVLASNVTVLRRGGNVNLVPSNLTVTPTTAAPDETVTVAYKLTNSGMDGILATTKTFFYLSTDAAFSNDDVKLGEQQVGALGAGLSVQLSAQVTIPTGTAAGSYFILAIANAENTLTETDATDNVVSAAFTAGSSVVNGVDLVVLSLSATPQAVPRRGQFAVNFTLKNRGDQSTQSFFSRIYLSTSSTPQPASDLVLATVNETGLEAGQQKDYTKNLTLPDSVAAGSYWITVYADPTNAVVETNDDNNVRTTTSPFVVQPPSMSDVSVSDVLIAYTPPPSDGGAANDGGAASDGGATSDGGANDGGVSTLVVPAGATLQVTFTLHNAGPDMASGYGVAIVRSGNSTFESSDVAMKTIAVPSLASGESRTIMDNVALPTDLGGQPFYIGVVADPAGDQLVDPVRSNNAAFWSNTVRMTGGSGCTDDLYEPNDTRDGGAARLTPGTYNGLMICPSNEDDFLVNVPQGSSLRASINIHGSGTSTDHTDLEMQLYGPTGSIIASSTSSTPAEAVSAEFVTAGGDYTVRVYPSGSSTGAYDLTVAVVQAGGAGIDLVPLSVSLPSRTSGGPSDAFQVRFEERNVGMTASPAFEFEITLVPVTGGTCTTTVSLGRFPAAALDAGTGRIVTQDLTVPTGTCAGAYRVMVTLDPRDAIQETYENNNSAPASGNFTVLSAPLCADQFEPNDTKATASPLSQGTYPNLRVCSGADDWYVIALAASEQLTVTLNFSDASGDIDMTLETETGTRLASSTGVTDTETFSYTSPTAQRVYLHVYVLGTANGYSMNVVGGAGVDLAVRDGAITPPAQLAGEIVEVNFTVDQLLSQQSPATTAVINFVQGATVVAGQTVSIPALGPGAPDGSSKAFSVKFPVPMGLAPGTYDVSVSVDPNNAVREGSETNNSLALHGFRVLPPCAADAAEPNDTPATAENATPADAMTPFTMSNLSVCPGDVDWFQVNVPVGTFTLRAQILFANANGDLDLYLYRQETDGSLTFLTRSAGNLDNETITQTGVSQGTYLVKVVGFGGASNASYGINVSVAP